MSLALNTVVANEEHRILGLLEHAAEFCDELVVVVDEASKDNTELIAREFGATVIIGPHSDWCEPLRPLAAEHTKGDWILVLDGDEVINKDHLDELLVIDRDRYVTALLPRMTLIGGVPWTKGADRHCRWFKKGAVHYLTRPHGYILPLDESTMFVPESLAWIWHDKTTAEFDKDTLREMRIKRAHPMSTWGDL